MNRDNDKGKVLINRSLIVGLGKIFLLLCIIGRLYYLQVYQADKYATLADENRISTRLLVPPRGQIRQFPCGLAGLSDGKILRIRAMRPAKRNPGPILHSAYYFSSPIRDIFYKRSPPEPPCTSLAA